MYKLFLNFSSLYTFSSNFWLFRKVKMSERSTQSDITLHYMEDSIFSFVLFFHHFTNVRLLLKFTFKKLDEEKNQANHTMQHKLFAWDVLWIEMSSIHSILFYFECPLFSLPFTTSNKQSNGERNKTNKTRWHAHHIILGKIHRKNWDTTTFCYS